MKKVYLSLFIVSSLYPMGSETSDPITFGIITRKITHSHIIFSNRYCPDRTAQYDIVDESYSFPQGARTKEGNMLLEPQKEYNALECTFHWEMIEWKKKYLFDEQQ